MPIVSKGLHYDPVTGRPVWGDRFEMRLVDADGQTMANVGMFSLPVPESVEKLKGRKALKSDDADMRSDAGRALKQALQAQELSNERSSHDLREDLRLVILTDD